MSMKDTNGLRRGAAVGFAGFVLYVIASALKAYVLSDLISLIFALFSLYVFLSAYALRRKDRDAVSYSLLWGTFALAALFCALTYLALRQRLGLG